MSQKVRRSLLCCVPVAVFIGQSVSAYADFARLEETAAASTDSVSSTSDSSKSTSTFLIPGILLAGGALFGLGMGGSGGGGGAAVTRDILTSSDILTTNGTPSLGTRTQTSFPNSLVTPPVSNTKQDNTLITVLPPISNESAAPTVTVNPIVPISTPPVADDAGSAGNGSTGGGSTGNGVGTGGNTVIVPNAGAPTSVPEPSALILGSSLLGAGIVWRLRRKTTVR